MSDYITVSLTKVPGPRNTFTLNGDREVADLLGLAEVSAEGYQIRVSGEEADLSHTLSDNDEVVLVKMIKGNAR